MKFIVLFSLPGSRWGRLAAVVACGVIVVVGSPLRAQEGDASGDPHTSAANPASLPPSSGAGHPVAAGTGGTGRAAPQNAALAGGNAGIVQKADQGPIDIISNSGTTYGNTGSGRVATFSGNVNIITNDASIYCDQADYNADTHEGILSGDVRIYRNDTTIVAERAIYNFNTKAIRALDFGGERGPYEFSSVGVFSPGQGLQYNLRNARFTTDDTSKPDFHLNARRVRIYPDNRVIYIGATLYVGATPVFYFPYFYQSLDQQSGYRLTPGYTSVYGAYLLTGITFPVADHLTGLVRLDYRSQRGIAGGLTFEYKPNKKMKTPPSAGTEITPYASDDNPGVAAVLPAATSSATSNGAPSPNNAPNAAGSTDLTGAGATSTGLDDATATRSGLTLTGEALSRQIRSPEAAMLSLYGISDDKPDLNRTDLFRESIDSNRYRVKLTDYSFFTDDLFFKADVDKLSDRYLLQDFYEGEFTKNPNPDNVISFGFYHPTFVATLSARLQLNRFFDATERLPDLSLDVPRTPLGKSGVFWQSENSAVYLHRAFDDAGVLPEYETGRFDTFHQFTDPQTLFGWLNLVPRVGLRATYYTSSAPSNTFSYNLQYDNDTSDLSLLTLNSSTGTPAQLKQAQELRNEIRDFQTGGGIFRPVANVGLEGSFKLSHVYNDVESRAFGLDKIQHIIQPYADISFTEDFGQGSRKLLQFDRLLPTTQLQPIDFPQFNSIDTIDETSAVRLGVRNRLQTKRDALTFNWLELDTFFQVNIYQPDQNATFANTSSTLSNLFNQLTFRPLPWVNFTVDSQLPVFNGRRGFTEVDSSLQFQATSNLDFTIQHRYLDNNPFFPNSSLLRFNLYYRIDDNWSAAFSERYEFAQHLLQAQSYTLYRDLSSFVTSFGVTVRNNNGVSDYGVLLNFTLKGVPKVNLPVGFDVNSVEGQLTQ